MMTLFSNYVKIVQKEYFDHIFKFGYVYLYSYLYDNALNRNVKEEEFSMKLFIDGIKSDYDYLNNWDISTNFIINSMQNSLPKNLWLLTFKKIYIESCQFEREDSLEFFISSQTINTKGTEIICKEDYFIFLDRLTSTEIDTMSTYLSNELIKISNCFILKRDTKLFRIIIIKNRQNHIFETKLNRFLSCSISFGECFFIFGINKIKDLIRISEEKFQVIIYEIYSKKEIKVISTSICCFQEEQEIVLVPGTNMELNNSKVIDINHVNDMLRPEDLPQESRKYVENFFQIYADNLNFLLFKIEI